MIEDGAQTFLARAIPWRGLKLPGVAVLLSLCAIGYGIYVVRGYSPGATNVISVGGQIDGCIEASLRRLGTATPTVEDLYKLNGFCYDSTMSEITVEEQAVSRDTYIFQRSENVALMVMVIVITVSGVALAGVQLITSYRLALLGRDGAAGEPTASELRYDHGSVVVKSSVVGVLILAISFAFFMVFVIYVYTIREAGSPVTGIASAVRSGAAATSSFNLLSARPDTKSAPVQNKPVSATP